MTACPLRGLTRKSAIGLALVTIGCLAAILTTVLVSTHSHAINAAAQVRQASDDSVDIGDSNITQAPSQTSAPTPFQASYQTASPAPTRGAASVKLAPTLSAQNLFDRVLVVVLENMDYKKAIRDPYFQFIMKKGAVFTNFHGIRHPSYPNYVAMVAGDTFDISTDHQETIYENSIADLLEAKSLSWKNYAEDYPGDCFLGKKSRLYVRKHVPFLSFYSIQQDSKRCANVVPSEHFMVDWKSRQLPTYSLFSPNLIDDGHNTNLTTGEKRFGEFFFRFSSNSIRLSHYPCRYNSFPHYLSLAMGSRISRSDCIRFHRYEWNSHRDNV